MSIEEINEMKKKAYQEYLNRKLDLSLLGGMGGGMGRGGVAPAQRTKGV